MKHWLKVNMSFLLIQEYNFAFRMANVPGMFKYIISLILRIFGKSRMAKIMMAVSVAKSYASYIKIS